MIIVGAKGFAKEVLEVLNQLNDLDNIVFFDDVTDDIGNFLFERFEIIKSINEVQRIFENVEPSFTLGVGNPKLRGRLFKKFLEIGGEPVTLISPSAQIGKFGNKIGEGTNIMSGVIITSDIFIGKGCLINLNCTIGHDSELGDFVELSPNVNISGRCSIGSYTTLGTNAVVIPDISIGENCIIAAGAVVTKNIPDNCLVAGVPGIIKKQLPPIV